MTADPLRAMALRACAGDELAFERLLRILEPMIWVEIDGLFFPGAGLDDVWQEARLGLYKATLSYDPAQGVPFAALARVCIRRSVITGIRAATRGRHEALSHSARLEAPMEGGEAGEGGTLADVLAGGEDPAAVVESRDRLARIFAALAELSPLERRAVLGLAVGLSMDEIGPRKRVDNATQRGRAKLARAIAE